MQNKTPIRGAAVQKMGIAFLAALFLTAPPAGSWAQGLADEQKPGFFERLRGGVEKEEMLPPVEDVYKEAEAFYHGRETWYGRLVRKVHGEDSWAYRRLPGVKRKNVLKARELYRQVVDNYPFSRYAAPSELKLADCSYKLEEYGQAAVLYRQFAKMHPKRDEVPYALYQEAMCHYERMLKPARDQESTREAEAVFRELIDRFPASEHAAKAEKKLEECRKRLAKHELLVAGFYFDHKEYWAAAARYRGLYRSYPGLGFDDQAMFMEASCYQELGKLDQAAMIYKTVAGRFEGEYAERAGRRLDRIRDREGP